MVSSNAVWRAFLVFSGCEPRSLIPEQRVPLWHFTQKHAIRQLVLWKLHNCFSASPGKKPQKPTHIACQPVCAWDTKTNMLAKTRTSTKLREDKRQDDTKLVVKPSNGTCVTTKAEKSHPWSAAGALHTGGNAGRVGGGRGATPSELLEALTGDPQGFQQEVDPVYGCDGIQV